MTPPTCQQCGSDQLRRAHVHSWRRRAYRRLTGLTRFECTACKRRGWTRRPLAPLAAAAAGPASRLHGAGRPTERRDLVAARQATARTLVSVSLSVVLGVLLALYLLRQGQ